MKTETSSVSTTSQHKPSRETVQNQPLSPLLPRTDGRTRTNRSSKGKVVGQSGRLPSRRRFFKPPGVRAQESQQGMSDAGKNEPKWRKYIEICMVENLLTQVGCVATNYV